MMEGYLIIPCASNIPSNILYFNKIIYSSNFISYSTDI